LSFIKLDGKIKDQSFFIVSADDCSETSHGFIVEPRGHEYITFYLFETWEEAGQHVRDYWKDFIESDPDEAVHMLGAENLIQWALGRPAGPGTSKVRSLEEWLDLHRDAPGEHFEEMHEINAVSEDLEEFLGFKPTVLGLMWGRWED